uniref:Uncharacterized protein n=1 Tax=Romanomermis culicivorax TaxID=13658 RepID=A0A915KJ82_ROMCU
MLTASSPMHSSSNSSSMLCSRGADLLRASGGRKFWPLVRLAGSRPSKPTTNTCVINFNIRVGRATLRSNFTS